ncbi:hypothetical protein KBX37_22400 [Micromonospora sp. U56]|uniref:hypothetical protein n=1 Tax=Micromonospora sp. U56 TaxID=2824900 RepID=UPI001B37E203|nr:hypothetical protein [Micromonospora sp. U56]MBQ0895813.1 hypothetical protein [Micromonospora sp. U56]
MIVWLNGAFGAGKTTVAAELCQRLPGARRFDPEWVDNHGRPPARWPRTSAPGWACAADLRDGGVRRAAPCRRSEGRRVPQTLSS